MAKKVKGKVRLAIIGAGGITGAHARGILEHKDKVTCVALCDVSKASLDARDEQLGGGLPRFKDWKKMLKAMAKDIDAVLIALPHDIHGAAIRDACKAGKHILCEKPMCTSIREANSIAAAVKKSGVTYMSAHNQLFLPVVQEAKKLITAGAIGRILWLRSQDCFRAPVAVFKGKWRANAKIQGGGELIDTGYHPTYRLLYLAGSEVIGVRGSMGRYLQRIEGEDTASVQVRFASGALGEILTSWAMGNPYGTHQIHVTGDKGQIFGSNNELYLLPDGYSQPAKTVLGSPDTFIHQMEHFATCLQKGKRPIHSVKEGREVLDVILAATKDADGWQKVAVQKEF
jgi:predicted dehydrogenase